MLNMARLHMKNVNTISQGESMRRLVRVFVAGLFLITGVMSSTALADEYVLVMSKNDKLCQHMLWLYNKDLMEYGEIQYDKHEEFTKIKWEEGAYFYYYNERKQTGKWNISRFDINADGKEEIVVKNIDLLGGFPTDSICFFKSEDSKLFENEFDKMNMDKAIGHVGTGDQFKSRFYKLTQLPAISDTMGGLPVKQYPSLAGHFSLRPLVFDGEYYIEMRDDIVVNDEVRFLVISRLNSENKLEDVCYCVRIPSCDSEKQERR